MNILIVEDDGHKIDDIQGFLSSLDNHHQLTIERSVRGGVLEVYENNYQLVILDMALPTFDQENKSSGGMSQPQGGLELIRTLSAIGKDLRIVILTQYPDIEIDGQTYDVENCSEFLADRYGCSVDGAIIYRQEEDDWKQKLSKIIEKVDADIID